MRLRHWTVADLPAAIALFTDEQVTADLGGPRPKDDIRAWVEAKAAAAAERPNEHWAAVHKADRRVIGFCGPAPKVVDDEPVVEIGYRLLPTYWGQGLATEAARSSRDYAFRELNAPKVVSIIRPTNVRSIRVAEKLGMTIAKETVYKGFEVRIYQITNPHRAEIAR